MRAALARIALALGGVVALLGGLELAGAALGLRPLAESGVFRMRGAALACRFDPAAIDKLCDAARWRERDPARKLVFLLGDSSVAGYHNPDGQNIPRFVRRRLNGLLPGVFEVETLAQPCKDSIYVRSCALRALEAGPAALIIYVGHNDFSGHTGPHPRLSIWMAEHGYWLFRLEQWLGHTRFWTLLATRGSGHTGIDRDPAGQLDEAETQRAQRQILENLLANFTRVIERASERGTLVVLVTVVSNLDEFPERRERWDALLAEADAAGASAPTWLTSYAEGIRRFRAGRLEDSLDAFRRARDARSRSRAPGMLNAALRELAAVHPDVVLVDFERQLDALSLEERAGIGCNFFGSESYCDGVHPNVRTSEMIGRAAADAVATALLHRETERGAVAHDPPGRRPGEVRAEDQRAAPR